MRNKNLVQTKLERIEDLVKSLNFDIGTFDRKTAYETLDRMKKQVEDIQTLLNTESQD